MPTLLGAESPTALTGTALVIGGAIGGWLLKVLESHLSQRTAFSFRFRLEKEYERYCDLWEKLVELRRKVGELSEPLGSASNFLFMQHVGDLFNAYQGAVRKGEPFMSSAVYKPAREIVRLAQSILDNERTRHSLIEQRGKCDDQMIAEKQLELDKKNDANNQEIEPLFQEVSAAIRQRVTPK